MVKDNRLFRILYYILEREKVTAKELAEEFEVSIRTIYRDIDTMSSTGIPVYATQGKGGGIEIAKEFALSKSLFTVEEKSELMAALQGLSSVADDRKNELLIKLSALFKMKNPNWIEVDFGTWQNNKEYERNFNTIKSAILCKNVISFCYFGSDKKETIREVKPIRLLFKGQDWYLFAFCLLRNDFRYFKLSRMKGLETSTAVFEDDFEGVATDKEVNYADLVRIKLKFDRKAAFRVYDELCTGITEDDKGNLYAEVEIPNDYNLYDYVFSFGENVEVLGPEEIRLQVKDKIKKLAKIYEI